ILRPRESRRADGETGKARVGAELRSYLAGWKEYFKLADTPRIFDDLDKWIRHQIRAIQLKHRKRGRTIYRELRARGLSELWVRHPRCLTHESRPNAAPRLDGSATRPWRRRSRARRAHPKRERCRRFAMSSCER